MCSRGLIMQETEDRGSGIPLLNLLHKNTQKEEQELATLLWN